MTVLRSRRILSNATPKSSQPSPPENVLAEPVTPLKTSELLNVSLDSTGSSSNSSDQNCGHLEVGFASGDGSVMVSEGGIVRRLSARLAKKGGKSEYTGSVEVVRAKRKKVEGTFVNGESGSRKSGMQVSDLELGVPNSGVIPDPIVTQPIVQDVGVKTRKRMSIEEKGKSKLALRGPPAIVMNTIELEVENVNVGDLNKGVIGFAKCGNSEEVVKDECGIVIETGVKTRRRRRIEEKEKMKLGVEASFSSGINAVELEEENVIGSAISGADPSETNEALEDRVQVRDVDVEVDVDVDVTRRAYMERFRTVARRSASRFAHFSARDELGSHAQDVAGREIPTPISDSGIEDWPGPFSTAMRIIKDREDSKIREPHSASTDKSKADELKWIPKNRESCRRQKQVPSLTELCLSVLSRNADAVTSLNFVPDVLRHKICWFLCKSRSMNVDFLKLLLQDTPEEIRLQDCSWLSEELFTKMFEGFNAGKLTVFQFDQCGGCMRDFNIYSCLARSPNSLPALTMISLKGAYSLSDAGLRMLVSAAPSLKSIDISQCPLLTSEGICSLASAQRLDIRELYLDYCHGIDAMIILPALEKLENLEVLSVAGIQTVCDEFVCKFVSAHGSRMKELVLADCMELTDSSLEVIGNTCSDIQSIDLTNVCQLTDISIGHLANGCKAIDTLKFCRNAFSDEAIAAYLDVRGASLKNLTLNNVIQVSNHTALSLARNCRNLRSLDLSWCRKLTNEALGLIVDSCMLLKVLKLFGCTKVTEVFVDGHSNPQVKLVGLKMTPMLKDVDAPDFLQGPLRYSATLSP